MDLVCRLNSVVLVISENDFMAQTCLQPARRRANNQQRCAPFIYRLNQ